MSIWNYVDTPDGAGYVKAEAQKCMFLKKFHVNWGNMVGKPAGFTTSPTGITG
jgi:hypothetical protein